MPITDEELAKEFANIINKHSLENKNGTPDFIIGEYLVRCFRSFETAVQDREKWYGRSDHGSKM